MFAAKSLQSCPTLCDPIDGSPPGSPVPGILQARTLEWGCHFLFQCMKVKSESKVAQSCPTLSNPIDYSLPGSSIHGIFQTRVLEWGAIAQFTDKPCSVHVGFFTSPSSLSCVFQTQSGFHYASHRTYLPPWLARLIPSVLQTFWGQLSIFYEAFPGNSTSISLEFIFVTFYFMMNNNDLQNMLIALKFPFWNNFQG